MTLVEQNVSHMVPAGNDGQPPDLPDGAVRGMHMLSAADFHFACGDAIRGDAPGSSPQGPSLQETLLPMMNSVDSLTMCSGS